MGLGTKIFAGVAVILLVTVLIFGYYGFVPVLSDIMGANTPRDLGVRYSAADLASANSKLKVTYTTLPSSAEGSASLVETGSQQINVKLTSEEATALLNDYASKWKYYPIDKIQVKFNSDNTIELSGVLRVDRWKGFADAILLPESPRSQVRPFLTYVKTNPSIYMKGTLSINSPPQVTISDLDVGRFSISGDQIDDYLFAIAEFIEYVVDLFNIHIDALSIYMGLLTIIAIIPTSVALSPP